MASPKSILYPVDFSERSRAAWPAVASMARRLDAPVTLIHAVDLGYSTTIPGFSGSLAALSPTATDPGIVIFQPNDSSTYAPLDVIQQKFTTGSALAAMGTPTPLLTLASGQTQGFSFLIDGSQRLWVAVNEASSTTYVVVAHRP